MKKKIITILLLVVALIGKSQTAKDLFNPSNVKISWLGIDFSHVKLIGDFSQFNGAGEKSNIQIRDKYFASWNKLIINEPDKYDIKGMLRKDTIYYDIDMIMKINSATPIDEMDSYNTPKYTRKDIEDFISKYDTEGKNGIGILFLAESLNKSLKEAYFHFVAIDMKTKKILIYDRLREKPKGFGLRNYWAGSIYHFIKEIKKERYDIWMEELKE